MVLLKRQAAAAAASRLQSQGHSASGPSTEVKRDSDHPMQDDTETKPNTTEENANVQQAVQNAIPVRNTTLPFLPNPHNLFARPQCVNHGIMWKRSCRS